MRLFTHSEIAGKFTAIWIGGGAYPKGSQEFNMGNDINAANIIFKSNIDLWQVPMNVYCRVTTSLSELQLKGAPYGDIGKYLFEQLLEVNDEHGYRGSWTTGEIWNLGDSPTIGLMLYPSDHLSEMREVPFVDKELNYHFDGSGRHIKVYNDIDSRLILEDMFAKLKCQYS